MIRLPAYRPVRHATIAAVLLLVFFAICVAADELHPCWIWGPAQLPANSSRRFVKTFHAHWKPVGARLRFAPISTRLAISLDGNTIATSEPYGPIQTLELASRIAPGDHELVVDADGVVGPSAFFLELELESADATRDIVVTGPDWQMADRAALSLGPIEDRLLVPADRRVEIDVVEDYEQWQRALGTQLGTDPASFRAIRGFQIQLVRSALPDEDSWVSLKFDTEGRAIIAREQAGLLRMTLSSDHNAVTQVEIVNDTLAECRGMVFVGDDLYVNANNSKGLYRLRSAGNGFAQPELIYASSGDVGHGRNDLAVSADGRLYSIHGDAVDLPLTAVDYTSPFRDARRGKSTREGHLLRIDPKSRDNVELLVAGLRNPFGIDSNADGELFTYDADAEYDMGSPWYRPTRVSHLLAGGDYGWRGVTHSWPPYYPDHPDNVRPNLDIGKGSPTAVRFGTASHFPQPYRDALFILDWAYGRIIAVHMIPRGSSYLMAAETFLQGRPLNVTDIDFGPDRNMYVVTGGRKTQSALYRISYVGERGSTPLSAGPYQIDRDAFAKKSRELRHELEAKLVQPPNARSISAVWPYLADPDPWIRYTAANVIEHHPIVQWQDRALTETAVTPAIQALMALARSGNPSVYPAILLRLNELLPELATRNDKHAAFYTYWLCITQAENLDTQLRNQVIANLNATFPSMSSMGTDYLHNRLLSEILVKLDAPDVVAKTIHLLKTASVQAEQLHYLYVLRNARQGWTQESRHEYFSGLAHAKHFLGGAGMADFLTRIREEAIQTLTIEERQSLQSLLDEERSNDEAFDPVARPLVKRWTLDQLLPIEVNATQTDSKRGADLQIGPLCTVSSFWHSRHTDWPRFNICPKAF